ncbi:MAG: protease complex subunit PrcB family protein, partial [Candidatus Bathyarchaeia archaeon]
AENVVYTIRLEYLGMTLWKGKLHQRQFTTDASTSLDRAIYNYYGGVGLFKRGIHIIATDKDPLALIGSEDFWRMLKDRSTQLASTSDFISILISRGDFSTGGYQIQLKSFAWLESNPVVFSFEANFTDPGNGVMVPEAFTNPLVLVPIGNLNAGRYVVEVHVKSFILTYDISGKIIYTPIETFIGKVWKLEFEIQ